MRSYRYKHENIKKECCCEFCTKSMRVAEKLIESMGRAAEEFEEAENKPSAWLVTSLALVIEKVKVLDIDNFEDAALMLSNIVEMIRSDISKIQIGNVFNEEMTKILQGLLVPEKFNKLGKKGAFSRVH